jgi:hypothetical protein
VYSKGILSTQHASLSCRERTCMYRRKGMKTKPLQPSPAALSTMSGQPSSYRVPSRSTSSRSPPNIVVRANFRTVRHSRFLLSSVNLFIRAHLKGEFFERGQGSSLEIQSCERKPDCSSHVQVLQCRKEKIRRAGDELLL